MIRDVAIDAGCKEFHSSQHGTQGTWRTWRKLCDDRVSLQKIAMQAIGASDSTEVCTMDAKTSSFSLRTCGADLRTCAKRRAGSLDTSTASYRLLLFCCSTLNLELT